MNYENTSSGIQFNEPLLWEKSVKSRSHDLFLESDVNEYQIDKSLIEEDINLPELSELDVVRHFTRFPYFTGIYIWETRAYQNPVRFMLSH